MRFHTGTTACVGEKHVSKTALAHRQGSRDALGRKRRSPGVSRALLSDMWQFSVRKALRSCVGPQRIRARTEGNFHSKIWENLLTVKVQVEVAVMELASFTLGQASKPHGQDATERTRSRRHLTTCPGDHFPTPRLQFYLSARGPES